MSDYKELYDSLCKAVAVLEAENKRMMRDLSAYAIKERQWAQERVSQQGIFQQMLDTKNREHNEILEENQKLREQLRQARSM